MDKKIDKEQLAREVELVERILSFAENSATLSHAGHLSIELMKTQRTNIFSSIDVNEYVCYRSDRQIAKKAKDKRGVKDAEVSIRISRHEIKQDLKKAKAILED
jgi:hypothetical protein